MPKEIIYHLPNTATILGCILNPENPDFDQVVLKMILNKTPKGNYPCPCSVGGKVFCPCKDWVQKIINGTAKAGDMCHCEVFVKVDLC